MKLTIESALGIGIFFLMLGAFIVPQWNSALTSWNASATGISLATISAILLVVFLVWLFKGGGKKGQ